MTIALDVQVRCVQREVLRRREMYPKAVARGSMTRAEAQRELDRMVAVLATLEALLGQEGARQGDLFLAKDADR